MRWRDFHNKKGIYISEEFNIGSKFEAYVEDLIYKYNENHGVVDVFLRVSFDSVSWSDWIKVNNTSYRNIFKDDYHYMEDAKVQYKVEMTNNGDISPEFISFSFSLFGTYVVENIGDVICKPEIWIKKKNGSGNVKLFNETNGQEVIFVNLNNEEEIYVDCENENIVSNLPLTYRYDNHNNEYLQLEVGDNYLTGEGDFEFKIRYEFKTLQG